MTGGGAIEATDGADLREVRFRFQHEGCWLQETTERHPSLMLVASSIYLKDPEVHMNVAVHGTDPEALTQAEAEWEADEHILQVTPLHRGPNGARFHVAYSWEASIYKDILEHTPISIGSIRFARGVEHYRLMGAYEDLRNLLRLLSEKGQLDLTSVRSVDDLDGIGPEAPGPWAALTDRQLEAVIAAENAGYYRWPRQQTASSLAEDLGLSSSAFLDQLRRGEAKLLSGLVSDLRDREPGRVQSVLERIRGQLDRP